MKRADAYPSPPLLIAGVSAETPGSAAQRPLSPCLPHGGRKAGACPFVPRPKRRGFTGGTWFLSPAQTAPGAPFYLTASVAGKTGSLRHCAALAAGRSRAARFAVPPGVSAETPAIERGGAERMRSGGVVGRVQEKVTCDRKPVPTRCPQPLSQTLRVCQLPLHRGAKPSGGRGLLLRRSQAQRGTKRLRILLKKSFFPQFCPGQRVSGALLFLENGKGIAAQHHLRSNPF